VVLLQLIAEDTQDKNLTKGIEFCKRAKAMGADIALFPEMWNTGYTIPEAGTNPGQGAVGKDSLFVGAFKSLAKELDMAIGGRECMVTLTTPLANSKRRLILFSRLLLFAYPKILFKSSSGVLIGVMP